MFAILAYQAAGLKNAVAPTAQHGQWVSDKYPDQKMLKNLNPHSRRHFLARRQRNKDIELYKKYSRRLIEQKSHKQSSKAQTHGKFTPSLLAWKEKEAGSIKNFNFANSITDGMCVDAKTTMPSPLLYSIKQNPEAWQRIGQLKIERLNYSKEDKSAFRTEKTQQVKSREEKKKTVIKEIENHYSLRL